MDGTGVFELRNRVLAGSLALVMLGAQAQPQGAQQGAAQQAIPDAPKPQTTLPGLGTVAPGQGSSSSDGGSSSTGAPAQPTPTAPPAASGAQPAANSGPAVEPVIPEDLPTADYQGPAYVPPTGEGSHVAATLVMRVNYVLVPFTVEDSKGRQVPGLGERDVQVFENDVRQKISYFTSDMFPLSVAIVIDQSMAQGDMDRVNGALGALQDAFTRYDEVAMFTYNKSTRMVTNFTGAQSARLTQAIDLSKGSGREPLLPGSLEGPLSNTTVVNNQSFDPNTQPIRGQNGLQLNVPREIHPLNDAILTAAKALSTRPLTFRRVIYVISDGKEYGSQAHTKDVIQYLQQNLIEVDATLVGESAMMGVGFIDRFHLPYEMKDNVLPAYWQATGGNVDREFRSGGIEKSFARIAGEVRSRYTLGYYTHEPFIDGKYRKLEVRVIGHGTDLNIIAKKGYFPTAMEVRPHVAPTAQ
jgi:VWFA-related protein